MKTFKLLGLLLFFGSVGFSQQVPRDKVVVEIGTGTWCYYCPGAALGADDLVANGKQVAIVEYHGGGVDNFINEYSTARIGYYGVTGYPTAYFDGGNAVVGGNHTVSMYPTYLQKYNQRINVVSSFTIDMVGSKIGLNDYQVNVSLEKLDAATYASLVMHFVVTESDIPQNWQGLTEVNFVERLMIPNQFGTTIGFSSSNQKNINIILSLNPSWVKANCEIVVFLQNPATKEIYQGAIRSLTEFDVTNDFDACIVNVVAPNAVCLDSFIPKITIGNFGLNNLTNLNIVSQVNGEASTTYNWTGNIPFSEKVIIELPEVNFNILSSNTFTVTCSSPNGQTDQYPTNDVNISVMADAMNVTSPVSLALKLDQNPGETTWTLLNSAGTTLYSGGPYTQPNQFVIQTFVLSDADCYTFIIYDSGGDGLLGAGMYKLAYNGSTIFAEGKGFGFEDQVQFGIGLTGINEMKTDQKFTVSPNPIKDNASVSFDLSRNSSVQLKAFNSMGELIFETVEKNYSAGNHTIIFENNNLHAGIYYFSLIADENLITQKVIITR
jgi:hypothetical protein